MLSKKLWLRITGTIFGIVAIMHLARILSGISVTIGTFSLPLCINWIGLIATVFLCVWLWRLSAR
jgi:hypothetical protein